MPEVTISIGGRDYQVACQEGEEHFLQTAAQKLDAEAQVLVDQIGRIPENRMLLMAGLMLADKAAGHQDQLDSEKSRTSKLEAELLATRAALAEAPKPVEVPVVPAAVTDSLAALAARAEALAQQIEERASTN